MLNPALISLIFKAASISRWNDYPKMVELSELDKQSHKFIIAYFLAKLEPDTDMRAVIEGAIFEFLSRVVVTDIRPDVFHQIIKTKANEVNSWVLSQLEPLIKELDNGRFLERFKAWQSGDGDNKERLILKAAGYLATKWEFSIVYQNSRFLAGIDELKAKVDEELEDYYELNGVRKIALNQKLARIVDLSGRLRFQRRWAQTQRLPQTSVLGHMLVVAIFAYFYLIKVGAGDKRLEYSFYCALFHDLPETLTRDIISPVKHGISGLNELISEYEMRLIDEQILPLVPQSFRGEFAYILGVNESGKDEFKNRTFKNARSTPYEGSMMSANADEYAAIDGRALKYCDNLAAFIEAALSISYGVKSKELVSGYENMLQKFKDQPKIEGVDFYDLAQKIIEEFELKPSLR